MKDQDQKLVAQKLANLDEYLNELEPYLAISAKQFQSDRTRQRAVERLVQIVVECTIDTNNIIIRAANLAIAATARESFQRLRDQHILDDLITERFVKKYVELRNVIVHLYEKVEPKTLYSSAQRLMKDAEAYARQIHRYLASFVHAKD